MTHNASPPRPTTELVQTHAERVAQEAEVRLHERQLILAEQCSSENPPDVRIRAWEKAHELRLPRDPEHAVLSAIAICTGLTIAQIQDVQRARRGLSAASSQNLGSSNNS
jgi:hypothetical protein